MKLLQNLQAVVAALDIEPHQPGTITTNGSASSFIRARLAPQGMIGIRLAAAETLQNLVRGLFEADARYKRGMTFKEFEDEVFSALLEQFYGAPNQNVSGADLKALEQRLDGWFSEQFGDFTAYVPCALVPHTATPF
ncbi:MAG TPA: hypothetical protein VHX99_07480, partial [Rhizomicrobium sp.]|nr:hypothetical protein [Rhizomicrobium sp.]